MHLAGDLALDPKLVAKLQGGVELSMDERERVNLLYVALTRPKHALILPSSIQDNLIKLRDIPLQVDRQSSKANDQPDSAMTTAMAPEPTIQDSGYSPNSSTY